MAKSNHSFVFSFLLTVLLVLLEDSTGWPTQGRRGQEGREGQNQKHESILPPFPSGKSRWRRWILNVQDNQLAHQNALNFKDEHGNSQLHLAVIGMDQPALNNLINSLDADAVNDQGETPLMLAAMMIRDDKTASLNLIKYLIENGANMLTSDKHGQTFPHKLISDGSPLTSSEFHEMVDYILSKHLSVLFNIQDGDGRTPLLLAARNIYIDPTTISILRKNNNVNFSLTDKNGKSALSYAFEGIKNRKLIPYLLNLGDLKHTKLGNAIDAMDEEAVLALVTLGSDINERNAKLETALIRAALSNDKGFSVKIIKFLIENGAKVTAKDKEGYTFLHRLVDDGTSITPSQFHGIAEFLISRNLTNLFNGCGILEMVVKNMEVGKETLTLLKNNGLNLSIVDSQGNSLLAYAILGGRSGRLLTDLILLGVNPKQLNKNKQSLLHLAAERGNVNHIRLFLSLGLNINAVDDSKKTPIHTAIAYGTKNVLENIRFLIEQRANLMTTSDENQESPYGDALSRVDLPDQGKLVQLLRRNLPGNYLSSYLFRDSI